MLADAGDVDRVGADLVGQLLENFLGSHHAVFGRGPANRVLGTQAVQVAPPAGDVLGALRRGLDDFCGEDRQGGRQVRDDRNVRVAVLRDLSGVDVDVHDGGARRERIQAAGDAVIETSAEGHDQVSALQGADGRDRTVHAGHAQVVTIRVGEGPASGQGGDNGGVRGLDQVGQGLRRATAHNAAADVEHGGLGLDNRAGRGTHLLHVRTVGNLVAGQVQGRGPGEVHLCYLRGLSDVHQHGAGAAGASQMEGLSEAGGNVLRVGDQERVLRNRHGRANDVRFLEGIGADQGSANLTGDHNDRHGVHAGVAQGGQHVRRAGAGGNQRAADLAGGKRVTLGSVARSLLMSNQNVTNCRRRHQGVVGRQNCAAGHTEHVGHAQGLEARHNSLGSGHSGGGTRVAHHSSSQSLGPSQRKTPVNSAHWRGCGE